MVPLSSHPAPVAPIVLPKPSFAEEAQSVLFYVRREARTVRCYVTGKGLATCFGADDEADDDVLSRSMLDAFNAHAETIRQLAERMLDRDGQPHCRALVITTSDVFRDLIQGGLSRVPVQGHASRGAA